MRYSTTFFLVTLLCYNSDFVDANWDDWWTYEGISGPAYWGLINPSWTMCNKVRSEDGESDNNQTIVYICIEQKLNLHV